MQRLRGLFRRPPRPKTSIQRPWALTACGRLIVLQGLGLLGLFWFTTHGAFPSTLAEMWQPGARGLLGLLLALNGLALLRLRPGAWNAAMTLQGAGLLLALIPYFQGLRGFVILQLLYGATMVLYLNHPEIRACFPLEPFEAPTEEQA